MIIIWIRFCDTKLILVREEVHLIGKFLFEAIFINLQSEILSLTKPAVNSRQKVTW